MDHRYPASRRVILGLCPGNDHPTPEFGVKPSVSASRMSSLVPNWRDRALGANAWWTRSAHESGVVSSHVTDVLRQTGCAVVVALGREVARELGVRREEFYTWHVIDPWPDWHEIDVLLFPHPSGLNRHWNDDRNRRRGTAALTEALRS